MTLPKSLESVLLKTIVQARYEGIFSLLETTRGGGLFPKPFDEHVPGTFFEFAGSPLRHEFKGQAFLPHMVYLDSQRRIISSGRDEPMDEPFFEDQIRRALSQDNMTILSRHDVISGRRIPNERFEDISMRIIENKHNAHRKIERLPEKYPPMPSMDDIVRSHIPPVPLPPGGIGTKATLTSALAVGVWKMRSFVDLYKRDLAMGNGEDPRFEGFYAMMRESQEPVLSDEGTVLARPNIIVAHASPYMSDSVSGLTRILGFRGSKQNQNRFGEFQTLAFQRATKQTLRTLDSPRIPEDAIWAYHVPRHGGRKVPIIAVHRHYASTEPGKRPRADSYRLLSPDQFGFDPEEFRDRSVEKLGLSYAAPVPGARARR